MSSLEIAICTYNRAQELDLCLTTLARQTAAKNTWQVLVIDNASTDNTQSIVEKHRRQELFPQLRIIHEKKQGLTSARQRAIKESEAQYIAFVDDDCYLEPSWIRELNKAIEKYPNAVAFGGRVKPTWPPNIDKKYLSHGWLFAEQPHGKPSKEGETEALVGAGLVINRMALMATGWVDQPLIEDRVGRGATSGGDVEISLRLSEAGGQLMYIPSMQLEHKIDPERQTKQSMFELSAGLGAGAALISLMQSQILPGEFFKNEIYRSKKRLRKLLIGMLKHNYSITDWRIYRAFELGYLESLIQTQADENLANKLSQKLS